MGKIFAYFITILAVSLCLAGCQQQANNTKGGPLGNTEATQPLAGGSIPLDQGGPGGQILSSQEKQTCGITAQVTEGPYYVSGTSQLTSGNLNYTNLPGSALTISGYVYEGLDKTKPFTNVVVDIWHADNDGSYHPNSNGSASKYKSTDLALRGYVTTDSKGFYSFTTIYPGEYTGRTRHIHIKIRAPGFNELTTQLIIPSLQGDALTFDEDSVAQGLPFCHLLTIDSTTQPATATFDFHLSPV